MTHPGMYTEQQQPTEASSRPGYVAFPSLLTAQDKPARHFSNDSSSNGDAEEGTRLMPQALGTQRNVISTGGIAPFSLLSAEVQASPRHQGTGLGLAGSGNDTGSIIGAPSKRSNFALLGITVISLLSLALSIWALATSGSTRMDLSQLRRQTAGAFSNIAAGTMHGASMSAGSVPVSRIAFGSCTAYDLRPQPVWTQVSQ